MDSLSASYLTVVFLAFLSGGTTLIGVALAIAIGNNLKMTAVGIGFSTGIMMLIPSANWCRNLCGWQGPPQQASRSVWELS